MKNAKRLLILALFLVCFLALSVMVADAAVGTQAELESALSAANAKTAGSKATTVTLTGNITVSNDASIAINGKHVIIDGQGKYSITRSTVSTAGKYLFTVSGGADVTFQNVTVNNYIFTLSVAEKSGSRVEIGSGATFLATFPSGFTDSNDALGYPTLVRNYAGNTLTVAAGGTLKYADVTLKARTIMIENYGILHVYGTLYDGVNANTSNHRLIFMPAASLATGELYIYDGAKLTINGTGGGADSCFIWHNAKKMEISGGTFSASKWASDTDGTLPVAGLMITGAASLTSVTGGTFTLTGGVPFLYSRAAATVSVTNASVTHTGAGNAFTLAGGGSLSVSNMKKLSVGGVLCRATAPNASFSLSGSTVSTGDNLFCTTVTDAGGVTCTVENCTVTTAAGKHVFYLKGTPATTVVAKDSTFKTTSSSGFLVYMNASTLTADVTLDNCKFSGGTKVAEATGSCAITSLVIKGGTYSVSGTAVHIGPGTSYTGAGIVIDGPSITSSGSVLVFGGTDNSVVVIKGGIFRSTGTAGVALDFGNSTSGKLKGTVYGGTYQAGGTAALHVYRDCNVTVWGGSFYYTGSTGNAVMVGKGTGTSSVGGTLTVKGGTFRAPNAITPIFYVVNNRGKVTVDSCVAMGAGNLITNFGSGSANMTHDGSDEHTVRKNLYMKNGATLRLEKGSAGLRFTTTLSAATYQYLKGIADGGALTMGTLVVPTQYVTWGLDRAGGYTREALESLGLTYIDIVAKDGATLLSDGSVVVKAAVVNILSENLKLQYTAISYVSYTVNGVPVVQYSNYNATKNTRTVYQVARAAANDLSDTEQGAYVNKVTSNGNSAYVGKYSPYTAEQWEIIDGWWKWNSTTKSEVKTIDLFLIAGQSNASGYSTITTSFKNTYGKTSYPYIYYSGATPKYYTTEITLSDGSSKKSITVLSGNIFRPGKTKAAIGQGWTDTRIGAEFGMATVLSGTYNATSGKYAGIVKFAVGGTTLTDEFSTANNTYGGNWCPPSYLATKTPKGEISGKLYHDFIGQVESAVDDYRASGFVVNIKSMFWMQGEGDRNKGSITTNYPLMFKALVEDMRAELAVMTPHSTDTVEVYVGEICKECGDMTDTKNATNTANFIKMQNTLDEKIAGVHIVAIKNYTNKIDNFHWTCDDMLKIGKDVGNAIVKNSLK